jgi:hypothetical protein
MIEPSTEELLSIFDCGAQILAVPFISIITLEKMLEHLSLGFSIYKLWVIIIPFQSIDYKWLRTVPGT